MIALSLLAEPVILIMYGDQWRPVIPLFQVLSLLGMFQALATVGGNVYLSQGKTALLFKIGLFSKTTLIVGIVTGLYFYGLQGMVWGYCLASAIAFLPELYFTGRIINVTLGKIILNFTPSLFMALAAAAAAWGVRQAIQLSLYPAFVVGGFIFFATYLALNLFLKPAAWVDLLQFAQHYKRKKK
jgi:PST family polysaccharide transporter